MIKSVLLVLEDGIQFHGQAIGVTGPVVREVVFNTSVTGYQEILTDPSYSHQTVAFAYPHIDNVGTNGADKESSQVHTQSLMIRDLPLIASNFHNTEGLFSYLKHHNIVTITDIDTRKLTRLLCEKGVQNGCIIAGDSPDAALALGKTCVFSGLSGMDLAKEVIIAEPYSWTQGSRTLTGSLPEAEKKDELPYHVVVYDFSAKRNILHMLVDRGCRLAIIPAQIPVEGVLEMNPDGIFLLGGPDDPAPCDYVITAIQKLPKADIPVFGIHLDRQLPALASGTKTAKVRFGHHGGSHPVKDVEKNVVVIIAQNHGFVVDEATLPTSLRIMRKSLFDGTLQGIHRTNKPTFSSQGHLEASPGSHDAAPLFNHFIALTE